jgi:cytochrome c2
MTVVSTHEEAGPPALPAPGVGGAGLRDHSAHDPVSPTAAGVTGLVVLVLVAGIAATLVLMNPAFSAGQAFGTPNQLGAPPKPGAALAPGSDAALGAQIIASKPCVGCHTIPGVPGATGTVGPNLAGVASRPTIAGGAVPNHGQDDLKKWVEDAPSVKPGTAMPNVGLTDDEATKVAAYLETLK